MTTRTPGSLTDCPTTIEIISLALDGDRAVLRAAVERTIAAGEPGQRILDAAFTNLAARDFTGDPDTDPLVLLLSACPHPRRTASGACTVCHTHPSRETITMPDPGDPGDPFDLPSADLPVLGDGFAAAHDLPDIIGRDRQARRVLTRAMTDVRAELLRVDNKVNALLALAGVLLGLAVIGAGNLHGLSFAAGCTATVLVLAAVVLLAWAMRPNLGGNFGFVFWARTSSAEQVLAVAGGLPADLLLEQAQQLRWLSIALAGKYRRIRSAVTLLLAALGAGVVAAALTLWAR